MNADILLRNPSGEAIAVVEAKGAMKLTAALAMDIRRRMVAHGLPAHLPYFLLLSQERGYLWQDALALRPDTLPTAEFPMTEVVRRYFPVEPGAGLHGVQLELLLMRWLNDLAAGASAPQSEPERILKEVGFLDAIREAQVMHEAPVGPAGVFA